MLGWSGVQTWPLFIELLADPWPRFSGDCLLRHFLCLHSSRFCCLLRVHRPFATRCRRCSTCATTQHSSTATRCVALVLYPLHIATTPRRHLVPVGTPVSCSSVCGEGPWYLVLRLLLLGLFPDWTYASCSLCFSGTATLLCSPHRASTGPAVW